MILREDYKSRDEVEGLLIFPKYHFKSQDKTFRDVPENKVTICYITWLKRRISLKNRDYRKVWMRDYESAYKLSCTQT